MRLRLHLALVPALAVAGCDTISTGGPPERAFLQVVQVDDAPLSDAGSGWDGSAGGGPEIYFRIYEAASNIDQCPATDVLNARDDDDFVFARTSAQPWYPDVDGVDFPLVWDVDPQGPGFEFRDLNRLYRVVLCDYDPFDSDEDIIETEAFTFAEFAPAETDGAEDIIRLEAPSGGGPVEVRLRLVYGD
ncbi:MAG: hypothetical protein AAF845_05415 [Bacteroidota bacterium]